MLFTPKVFWHKESKEYIHAGEGKLHIRARILCTRILMHITIKYSLQDIYGRNFVIRPIDTS